MIMQELQDLAKAEYGSFYTICGAGGNLEEWKEGYEKLLEREMIGKPTEWFRTTGKRMNWWAMERFGENNDPFEDDTTIIMFPLDGLDIGKLAIFKLQMADRWFDDIIDNMR